MTVSAKSSAASANKYTAESRSTSAGSDAGARIHPARSELPEYDYPVPMMVRNTFIDMKNGRSVSLEEFFEERRIHSCPVAPPDRKQFVSTISYVESSDLQPLQRAIVEGAQACVSKFAEATGFWAATPTASECESISQTEDDFNIPEETFNGAQQTPRVLMLSEALPAPEIGLQEFPTVGSAGHYNGTCKPCAFLYTRGCESGPQCAFCHLCPPDEKRRRQKDKKACFREMRRQRRNQSYETVTGMSRIVHI